MNIRNQLICAWAGLACFLVFFIGLWPIAQFLPPHSPSAGADQIANIYLQHVNQIRFGLVLLVIAAALYGPFCAAVAMQMKRIEGEFPVMTCVQLLMAAVNIVILLIPMVVFMVVAFRPERSPELSQLLNDFGWLLFIMPFSPIVVQNIAIGLTVLSDQRSTPIYPRWVAFANFWIAILFLPGALVPFFQKGPFAWNGLFGWWVPVSVFGLWFLVMIPMTIKAIKVQATTAQ